MAMLRHPSQRGEENGIVMVTMSAFFWRRREARGLDASVPFIPSSSQGEKKRGGIGRPPASILAR